MRTIIAAGLLLLLAADFRIAEGDQGPNPNIDLSVREPPRHDPLAEADDDTRRKMTINVDTPANRNLPLGDMLTFFADRFDVKFEIDKRALIRAGLADVLKKRVVHPEVRKTVFIKVLTDVLGQARCEFYVKGDRIIIVPKGE
jgi:hypothetical protein